MSNNERAGSFAPVALFVYKRLWHTRQTLESLRNNEFASESDLVIFSDAPQKSEDDAAVSEVREYIKVANGFKSVKVVERTENLGLANSIIDGVTRLCAEYGKVIVLEDDLVTTPYFLRYMNKALEYYKSDERVISIHGYMFPVTADLPETFFLRDPGCWGWATWKRGWELFESDGRKLRALLSSGGLEQEFNFSGSYDYLGMLDAQIAGNNDSWAVRWYASAFLLNKLTLYPGKSLVRNVGHDGSGRHGSNTSEFTGELATYPVNVGGIMIEESQFARSALINYLMSIRGSWVRKLALNFRGKLNSTYAFIVGK